MGAWDHFGASTRSVLARRDRGDVGLWLSWMWRNVSLLAARHAGSQGTCPPCDPTRVPPAYYVEIRSLQIAAEEPGEDDRRRSASIDAGREPRPWPFRWPSGPTASVEPAPVPAVPSPNDLGNYLDILV